MNKNHKGFIGILAIIAIGAATILSSAFYVSYKTNQALEKANKEALGATILQTELTNTIGTFRTNVNTSLTNLNADLSNATSGNPGHYHTLSNDASATGTLNIAKGGTATTTFTKGLVMASGTDAMSSLAVNGNGSIPIASGTTWVANTLTAGSNITITNSVGGISIESGVTAGYVYLASTTLSTASSSITVDNIPARQQLFIYLVRGTLSSGTNGYTIGQFNDAGGTAYANRYEINGAADAVENTSANFFVDYDGASDTSTSSVSISVQNASTTDKMILSQAVRDKGGAAAPAKIFSTSIWHSKAQITKVVFSTAGGQTMAAGSYVNVFGTTF